MLYNYKNINIKLNNNDVLADSAILSTEAVVDAVYTSPERHTVDYNQTDNVQGNFRISYLLTGVDFLKSVITNDNVISGNISEMYFTGGYLSSYSLKAGPNSPARVDANIVFFDRVYGTFAPATPITQEATVLNLSDANLDFLSTYSSETIDNILNLDYSYSCEVIPVYYTNSGTGLTNVQPNHVNFGVKQAEAQITCDNLNTTMPLDGRNMGVKINFKHPSLSSLSESVTISGVMYKKEYRTQAGDNLVNVINIRQNRTDEIPVVTSYTPTSGYGGDLVTINGSNLSSVSDIIYDTVSDYSFSITSDSQIKSYVPYNALSGDLKVRGHGGLTNAGKFHVRYEAVRIDTLSPYTGYFGDSIQISGSGFYGVQRIDFSGQSGSFRRINSNVIEALIPSGAIYGAIGVVSNTRSYTGYSPPFVPRPRIDGFTPRTGVSGDYLTISGWNFSGINYLSFGDVRTTGHTVLNNSTIITYVPSGNADGYIKITGLSGVTEHSKYKFSTSILVTGITPTSGYGGTTPVSITGVNFLSGVMYALGQDYFKVGFGNYSGAFRLATYHPTMGVLTGLAPSGALGGVYRVRVYKNDGITTSESNINFRIRNQPPAIYGINPQNDFGRQFLSGVTSGFNIVGRNLFDVTGVYLTGMIQNTNHLFGRRLFGDNLKHDLLGKQLLVTGMNLNGDIATGRYEVKLSSIEGDAYNTGTFLGKAFVDYSGIVIVKNYYQGAVA